MDLDAACHRLAAPSYGVVPRERLLAVGMSADQVHRRLRAGVLVRLQPSVYAVASAPDRFEQRLLAACLAAGHGAAASHRSAARLWGLRGAASDRIEITVPGSSRRRLRHVTVHRSRVLEPGDLRRLAGIPVTRPERTLVDCAADPRPEVVAGLVESAVLGGLTTVDRLWRHLDGCLLPGAGVLRAVLEARDPTARPTESRLEDLTLAVLRRFGVPAPVRQHPIDRFRLDFAYPARRVALEVDSARWHSDTASYRRDREKWNLLTRIGWVLVIATEFDLRERPAQVAADVRAALGRAEVGASAAPGAANAPTLAAWGRW